MRRADVAASGVSAHPRSRPPPLPPPVDAQVEKACNVLDGMVVEVLRANLVGSAVAAAVGARRQEGEGGQGHRARAFASVQQLITSACLS